MSQAVGMFLLSLMMSESSAAPIEAPNPPAPERPIVAPEVAALPVVRVGDEGIRFEVRRCTPQIYSYDYDFGNVSVTVQGAKDDVCVFYYNFEMEGGATLYLCQVPRSAKEVSVQWTWRPGADGRGGHNYMKTSFAVEGCKTLGSANLFEDFD